jgi:hypothetical protein
MAYLKDLPKCELCGRGARVELFDRFGRLLGRYCRQCGRMQLRAIQQRERWQARTVAERGAG